MVRCAVSAALSITFLCAGCGRAQPAPEAAPAARVTMDFESGDLAGWRITGDARIAADRAHGGGQSLIVPRDAEAFLPLSEADGAGSVSMWVYDTGFTREGAAATEYAYGPLWGLSNSVGQHLVFGPIWAPFLAGNDRYGWVSTAQNDWFDRCGRARAEGWRLWEFTITEENAIRVTVDGVDAPDFSGANCAFDRGLSGIFIRGARDVDMPVYIDDITAEVTGATPRRPLKPFPRTAWPLPADHPAQPSPAWTIGPWQDPGFFPCAVWLQDPANAERFREAGMNLYVGLWQGPTEEQLAALKAAGMPVICDQNAVGLAHRDDPTIVGWMQQDEPDNAQAVHDPATGEFQGYGPPVPPNDVVERYEAMKGEDPARPVFLNLGQGVANEAWSGRGSEGKPEDYDGYVWGGDILSFDVYPVTNSRLPDGGHELWYVAKGLDRLRSLSNHEKIVWSALECTHVDNSAALPSPAEIRAQAWMSVIHGATGLVWFVHEFSPAFIEAGLFAHPEQLAAVTSVNKELQALAPVLRGPTRSDLITVESANPEVPVDALCKEHGGAVYVFAIAMQDGPAEARFTVAGLEGAGEVEVLGEDRKLPVTDGAFSDRFDGWGVHLYRIAG